MSIKQAALFWIVSSFLRFGGSALIFNYSHLKARHFILPFSLSPSFLLHRWVSTQGPLKCPPSSFLWLLKEPVCSPPFSSCTEETYCSLVFPFQHSMDHPLQFQWFHINRESTTWHTFTFPTLSALLMLFLLRFPCSLFHRHQTVLFSKHFSMQPQHMLHLSFYLFRFHHSETNTALSAKALILF